MRIQDLNLGDQIITTDGAQGEVIGLDYTYSEYTIIKFDKGSNRKQSAKFGINKFENIFTALGHRYKFKPSLTKSDYLQHDWCFVQVKRCSERKNNV